MKLQPAIAQLWTPFKKALEKESAVSKVDDTKILKVPISVYRHLNNGPRNGSPAFMSDGSAIWNCRLMQSPRHYSHISTISTNTYSPFDPPSHLHPSPLVPSMCPGPPYRLEMPRSHRRPLGLAGRWFGIMTSALVNKSPIERKGIGGRTCKVQYISRPQSLVPSAL